MCCLVSAPCWYALMAPPPSTTRTTSRWRRGSKIASPAPKEQIGEPCQPCIGIQASTPTVDRYLAGPGGLVSTAGRPPLMIRCCAHNRRSDGGRRPQPRRRPCPVAGRAGGAAGPGRGPVSTGGATTAGPGVRLGTAGGPAAQELLDDRRARRGPLSGWDAAPAGPRGLGPRRGA